VRRREEVGVVKRDDLLAEAITGKKARQFAAKKEKQNLYPEKRS
jgi:hypothetical protein